MISMKENMLRVIHHDSPHWIPNGNESFIDINSPVVERPKKAGYDAFGVHWSYSAEAEGGTYPSIDGYPIKDITSWRDYLKIPDLDETDWSGVAEMAKAVDRENSLIHGKVQMGLFERSYLLLGMENALVAYLTEPEEMYQLIGAIADYKIAVMAKLDDVINMDIQWYGDDWGTQSNLFLPVEVWRALIKPHTKRIYDSVKKRGRLIDQHSCGKIESIFGDLVELGADIWYPCQPCNDLAGLKKEYGKMICFKGGIDTQKVLDRPGVTEAEIRNEVRKRIDEMAPGGGYVAAPSHNVLFQQYVLEAMNSEIDGYGRRFYTN